MAGVTDLEAQAQASIGKDDVPMTVTAESAEPSSSSTVVDSNGAPSSEDPNASAASDPEAGIADDPAVDPRPYHYPPGSSRYAMSKNVDPPPCYKRRVGNFYVCVDCKKDGVDVPCCMFGPCWPMMLMTMSLILGSGALAAGAFGSTLVKSTEGIIVLCGGLFFVVFTAVCFGCTACRNPGIYPRVTENLDGEMIWHEESQSYRPRRFVQWDNESRVLAYKIDHFCPWTGTLIARDNLVFFNFFTSCLMFACIGVAVIVIFGLVGATRS